MRDDAVLGRALPLDRGLGPQTSRTDALRHTRNVALIGIIITATISYLEFVYLRQSRLTESIMFSTCPSVRYKIVSKHDTLKM